MKVSVIIGARNEFPNAVHTFHSLANDLEMWTDDWEVILYDQLSDDRTATFLDGRGAVVSGKLKIRFDPVFGNVSTRDKAVRETATGDVIMFCDAHMSIKPGATKLLYDAAVANPTALVHPVVAWMGAYGRNHVQRAGHQYSVKISGRLWGTWAPYAVIHDAPFAIFGSGHCFLAVKRDRYLKIGGYPQALRTYGGGEFYLDAKNWMFGGINLCEPRALVYHLSSGRGYAYHADQLLHNMAYLSETVAGRAWAERCRYEYLNKQGALTRRVDELFAQAYKEAVEDKAFILKNRVMSFENLLQNVPWDQWNRERHGRAHSGILIYDVKRIFKGDILERFLADPAQQKLERFIHGPLKRHVYQGGDDVGS